MSNSVVLGTRVHQKADQEIIRAIKAGKYLNKADFLRSAVRSELEKVKDGSEVA